jgi:hypothetical protein
MSRVRGLDVPPDFSAPVLLFMYSLLKPKVATSDKLKKR